MKNINKKYLRQDGTALLMTVLILNSVLLISLAVAQIIFSGIRMGAKESESTRAYFAAETGAERVLYEFRKGGCKGVPTNCNYADSVDGAYAAGVYPPNYYVNYQAGSNVVFVSAGNFMDQYRTVELDFNY
jgi:hypothetical protein